jgi:hypothetical protein
LKKLISLNALLIFLAATLTFAHVEPERARAAKFSSVYTNLKTQCASALTKKEEKEAEAMGQDIPFICKGYGGYEIYLGSHGAFTQLRVERKTDKESVVTETLHISDPIYNQKVEWRLADGQPFAVIFRRDLNDEPDDPANVKKIGEALRVIGLKDKNIDFWVDVKKFANPNEEARKLADAAYTK